MKSSPLVRTHDTVILAVVFADVIMLLLLAAPVEREGKVLLQGADI